MGVLFKIQGMIIAKTTEKLIVLMGSKENCITSRSNLSSHDLLHCQWTSGVQSKQKFHTGDEIIARGYVLHYNRQRKLKLISLEYHDS
ncbi:MAG TPA: hypothetical protein QF353_00515 [Gammaproteobacteria bacterium]|nr:hypothetical protein [Gammaproteobacteria bacterium]